jgi:hypothetical protein
VRNIRFGELRLWWCQVGITDAAARHVSPPYRSETTLGCRQQLTGRLSKARNSMPRPDRRLMEIRHFAIVLGPASGRSAVLGRNALAEPGDCNAARRPVCGPEPERMSRSATNQRCGLPAGRNRTNDAFEEGPECSLPIKVADRCAAQVMSWVAAWRLRSVAAARRNKRV